MEIQAPAECPEVFVRAVFNIHLDQEDDDDWELLEQTCLSHGIPPILQLIMQLLSMNEVKDLVDEREWWQDQLIALSKLWN